MSFTSEYQNANSSSLWTYLEVISKGPGAQHLKEGVMIDILAHVIQVIVFAASSDAFLSVGSSAELCHRVRWVNSIQKDGFELKKKEHFNF